MVRQICGYNLGRLISLLFTLFSLRYWEEWYTFLDSLYLSLWCNLKCCFKTHKLLCIHVLEEIMVNIIAFHGFQKLLASSILLVSLVENDKKLNYNDGCFTRICLCIFLWISIGWMFCLVEIAKPVET